MNWEFQTYAEISRGANIFGEQVIFGSQDTFLYCLNQATGDVKWKLEMGDQIRCTPTIVENRTFVAGCDGFLHIVDIRNGTEIAKVDIESPTGVTAAVMGDTAFFGTEQAGFYAIDWKRAEVKWSYLDPTANTSSRSSPAVTKSHVIFGSRSRKIYSLNPETGAENWTYKTRGEVSSSPVIAGDRVYVGSEDGRMYVLELQTGKLISEIELSGSILSSPAVVDGRLIVATSRGIVYCLGTL